MAYIPIFPKKELIKDEETQFYLYLSMNGKMATEKVTGKKLEHSPCPNSK